MSTTRPEGYPLTPEHDKLTGREKEHRIVQNVIGFISDRGNLTKEVEYLDPDHWKTALAFLANMARRENSEWDPTLVRVTEHLQERELSGLVAEYFEINVNAFQAETEAVYQYVKGSAN